MMLIDGDIIAYRIAWACDGETTADFAKSSCDTFVSHVLLAYEGHSEMYRIYLTGKGNFRHDYAVTAPYKGNRKSRPPPRYLKDIREHLIDNWDAVVVEGEEADDAIAIDATTLGEYAIMASIDKDFLQVPCWHYNLNRKTLHEVGEFEGLVFFYTQILMGDKADNIFGIKGVGPVKAGKMLLGETTEHGLYCRCVAAYGGDTDKVVENARLLWLRRKEGEIWQPPVLN